MKLISSPYDAVINVLCLLGLVGTPLVLAAIWGGIPAEIPGHYNALGAIDGMAGKGTLIVLVLIAWALFVGISVIECFPRIWSTGVTVTEHNRAAVYRILKSLLGATKLVTVAVFLFLSVYSATLRPLPVWFLPGFLALEFGPMLFFLIRLYRVR